MFDKWFTSTSHRGGRVSVLREIEGGRESIHDDLVSIVADHLVDLSVIEQLGGFEECHDFIVNRMPTTKRARSGDLGEILATEYIESETDYTVPVRRLRYKDDRNNAMRGDDVIGVAKNGDKTRVLKTEAKSRVTLSDSVLQEARAGLKKNKGRPNPGTLAFIQYILAKEDRMDEVALFKQLQDSNTLSDNDVEHLLFTLTGNDPTSYVIKSQNARKIMGINLRVAGLMVDGHVKFVEQTFNDCLTLGTADGDT